MDNLIEKINYRDHEIEVFYDVDAQSPDSWGNEDAFIIYDHRDFFVQRKGFDPYDVFLHLKQGHPIYEGYWIIPLFAYIHSGVHLSINRRFDFDPGGWDTSFKGFVLVKRQKGWSYHLNKAFDIADSIAKEWNCYLSGDVYGYNSPSGSCWGFFGEEGKKEMILEAKAEIDHDISLKMKRHFIRLKRLIKSKVPFQFRPILSIS